MQAGQKDGEECFGPGGPEQQVGGNYLEKFKILWSYLVLEELQFLDATLYSVESLDIGF